MWGGRKKTGLKVKKSKPSPKPIKAYAINNYQTPFQLECSGISWMIPYCCFFLPSSVHGNKIWMLNHPTCTLYGPRVKLSKLFKDPRSLALEVSSIFILSSLTQEENQGRPKGIEGFPNSSISFLFSQITIKATEPVNVANNVYFFWYFNFNTVYLFFPLYLFLCMWSKSVGLEVACARIIRAGPLSLWLLASTALSPGLLMISPFSGFHST